MKNVTRGADKLRAAERYGILRLNFLSSSCAFMLLMVLKCFMFVSIIQYLCCLVDQVSFSVACVSNFVTMLAISFVTKLLQPLLSLSKTFIVVDMAAVMSSRPKSQGQGLIPQGQGQGQGLDLRGQGQGHSPKAKTFKHTTTTEIKICSTSDSLTG